jgi:engulfment/cell motility protein 1
VLDLIQRQRLAFLVNGTRFSKGKKERGKFVFCRLSPNQKALHYGDCSSEDTPAIDTLPVKLPIAEIKDFLVGPVRDQTRKGGKTSENLTLTFLKENDESLDLLAPDQKTFDYWTDGVCALLRREMKSAKAVEDLEMLLSMEVKIRLLPLEGIDIPEEPPKMPPLPSTLPECFSA